MTGVQTCALPIYFDRDGNRLLRTREAAHSRPRILHANGDATGAEISRSLTAMARGNAGIRFAEWITVTGLVSDGGRVVGADLLDRDNRPRRVSARSVLIAAGRAGQVYSDTTNPQVATGDGIALAAEAGAELADMEFYQFHPTALSLPGVPRFLLSEALRGEGAILRNDRGERFMDRYHANLELAPRDVVARAIAREGMSPTGGDVRPVYIDMRHLQGVDLHKRFPGVSGFLARHGLDLHRDLIPVRPAAHYLMGGIRTDLNGRTSLAGLYAAGEAACTGVHGANRLASNSLLEGLVFGARAARCMLEEWVPLQASDAPANRPKSPSGDEEDKLEGLIQEMQRSMWALAGLLRDGEALRRAMAANAECRAELDEFKQGGKGSRRLSEALALNRVSDAILQSGLARTESRGAHFRNDFPQRDDMQFQKHSVLSRNGSSPVLFETW